MTATCSRVAIIQHMFILLIGEASPENRINPTSIQGIIQDKPIISHGDGCGDDHHEIDAVENAGSRDKSANIHTKDQ